MNISVLGCGRWGSFIAHYLSSTGNNVVLWGRENSASVNRLLTSRSNDLLTLHKDIKISVNLKETIKFCDIIIISISAQNLRYLMPNLLKYDIENRPVVLCMKGIEESSGKRLTGVVKEFTNIKTAIWVGPGHVQDFLNGIPNCMVIDSEDSHLKVQLAHSFSSELIRFYIGTDIIGNEIGAAAKNVIGIAAGILDGMSWESLKGALMSRGTREISRLIKSAGGNELTAYGLSHLGDYQATLFSQHSHNRIFGENFVLGKPFSKLAEGVYTTKALIALGRKYNIDLPICNAVNSIIHFGESPQNTIEKLFMRSLKDEF